MKFKRVISVILCIMMLLGNAGIAVSSSAAEIVVSGECGENVSWSLDSNGTLTLSGYGEMDNWYTDFERTYELAPWYEYADAIKAVVIEDGITGIGDYAFCSCYNIQSVELPDSIISIGDGAFSLCVSLTEITLPDGLEALGYAAFYLSALISVTIPASVSKFGTGVFVTCPNLTSVTIEDGVSRIGTMAFLACNSLRQVKIPDSVTSVGMQAFASCMSLESVSIGSGVKSIGYGAFLESESIKSFVVDENNAYYSSLDGVLYNKDKTELIAYPVAKEANSFEIPDGVKTIGMFAFYNCLLESIFIPESVESLVEDGFSRADKLKSISVDENNAYYSSLDGVLYNKDKTVLIAYPATKEATVFEIPYGVKSIAYEAVYGADNLVNVSIPDSVTSIDDYVFSACSSLEAIEIPESVVSIGDYAFSYCNSLSSISIPDSVISIGEAAFGYNEYYYDENNWENGFLYIDNHLIGVKGEAAGELAVREGTITVNGDIFDYYSSVTRIIIPASVRGINIGFRTYIYDKSLTEIVVDAGNEYYCSVDGVLYSKNKDTLLFYPAAKSDSAFVVSADVKTVADYAFEGNTFLESVTFENGAERIGSYAFDGCSTLSEIVIPDSVTGISYEVFRNTAYYNDENNWQGEALYIGNHLVAIKTDSFTGSSSVESITIKDGTKTLAEDLFIFSPLTSIVIPGSVEAIDSYVFPMCDMLESVTIENGVKNIGSAAFMYCSALENITIPESVEGIGAAAFFGCTSLESISILNPECEIEYEFEDEAGIAVYYGAASITIPATAVIYGYRNSTAQAYAEKYGNTFIALDGEEASEDITVSDRENSGVQFDFAENIFDESHGKVSVEIKKDVTQSQYLLSDFSKVTAWNITFYNEAGEEIQPGAPVTVKMPVPEGYNTDFLMVLHIDPQTNQSSMVDFTVEDGFVVFEAGSFSVYALVDISSEIEEEEPVVPEEPVAPSCDHMCHKSGFVGVIWKIVRFFWKLFNMNPVCECGAMHY